MANVSACLNCGATCSTDDHCRSKTCEVAQGFLDTARKDLAIAINTLNSQTITLPNDARIEVIECNGDAFNVYQEQIELADRAINLAIIGPLHLHQTITSEK